jgi:hypothetical protein
MKSWLPRFREENPQLEILEVLKRGGHPFLNASFSKFCFVNSIFDGAVCYRRCSARPNFEHCSLNENIAEFVAGNGNTRMVTLRNHLPEEILRQAAYLRSCTGRKTSLRIKQRTQTATPSIQGQWNPKMQDMLKE